MTHTHRHTRKHIRLPFLGGTAAGRSAVYLEPCPRSHVSGHAQLTCAPRYTWRASRHTGTCSLAQSPGVQRYLLAAHTCTHTWSCAYYGVVLYTSIHVSYIGLCLYVQSLCTLTSTKLCANLHLRGCNFTHVHTAVYTYHAHIIRGILQRICSQPPQRKRNSFLWQELS